jgi:HK97 gp10 family phage protein
MAGDVFEVKVRGVEDVVAELRALVPKLRKRAIMNALRAGARVVRDDARRLAPVAFVPVRRRGAVIRMPGTVRKAISVRTSKQATRAGDLGVFVNVKPAKGALRGSPRDPFYWRFLEFGTVRMRAHRFLQGAASGLLKAKAVIENTLGPQIQKLNQKGVQP